MTRRVNGLLWTVFFFGLLQGCGYTPEAPKTVLHRYLLLKAKKKHQEAFQLLTADTRRLLKICAPRFGCKDQYEAYRKIIKEPVFRSPSVREEKAADNRGTTQRRFLVKENGRERRYDLHFNRAVWRLDFLDSISRRFEGLEHSELSKPILWRFDNLVKYYNQRDKKHYQRMSGQSVPWEAAGNLSKEGGKISYYKILAWRRFTRGPDTIYELFVTYRYKQGDRLYDRNTAVYVKRGARGTLSLDRQIYF